MSGIDKEHETSKRVTMFNFETKEWSSLPELNIENGVFISCTANAIFSKKHEKEILILSGQYHFSKDIITKIEFRDYPNPKIP